MKLNYLPQRLASLPGWSSKGPWGRGLL